MVCAAKPFQTNVNQPPVRFGVLCNETPFRAWQVRCLEALLALKDVHLTLLIVVEPVEPPAPTRTQAGKSRTVDFKHSLYHLYQRYVSRPSALRPVDSGRLTAGVPTIHCKTRHKARNGRLRQFFAEADIRTVCRHKLDFILHFGSGLLGGEILHAAPLGIWSFLHGDPAKYRGEPPCFWEIYHDDPVTAATLYRPLDGTDGGVILKQGFLKTLAHSHSGNLDRLLYECALWPAQVCRELRHGGSSPWHGAGSANPGAGRCSSDQPADAALCHQDLGQFAVGNAANPASSPAVEYRNCPSTHPGFSESRVEAASALPAASREEQIFGRSFRDLSG